MEDVQALLADTRFSSDRGHPDFPPVFAGVRPRQGLRPSLLGMDPPQHGHERRQVVGEFKVKQLRPRIQQIVDDRINALLATPRPADLVAELALPVPTLVICKLLGVPYDDNPFFQSRSVTLLVRTVEMGTRVAAIEELHGYLDSLVLAKEAEATDDLLGRQIAKPMTTTMANWSPWPFCSCWPATKPPPT